MLLRCGELNYYPYTAVGQVTFFLSLSVLREHSLGVHFGIDDFLKIVTPALCCRKCLHVKAMNVCSVKAAIL